MKEFDTGFEKDCWIEKKEQLNFLKQFGDDSDFQLKEEMGDYAYI